MPEFECEQSWLQTQVSFICMFLCLFIQPIFNERLLCFRLDPRDTAVMINTFPSQSSYFVNHFSIKPSCLLIHYLSYDASMLVLFYSFSLRKVSNEGLVNGSFSSQLRWLLSTGRIEDTIEDKYCFFLLELSRTSYHGIWDYCRAYHPAGQELRMSSLYYCYCPLL